MIIGRPQRQSGGRPLFFQKTTKMKQEQTFETRVADALLQRPKSVNIGGREYAIAPPSVATLIRVSELVAQLPNRKLNDRDVVSECLAVAKDTRVLGTIVATLVLGARRPKYGRFKRLFKWAFKRNSHEFQELSEEILYTLSPAELHALVAQLLQSLNLGDFFALTTFLTEINMLRPTKVDATETTASGQ